jgi:pyridoxal/pyridoxine/pyridoxamine kinase
VEAKWCELGIKFDAFYTGYVSESHIDPILSIMDSCANPGALRIVDPAMADNGRLYAGFGDDFPSKMARLCNGADYLLPNLTEAALLTDSEVKLSGYSRSEIEELVAKLHALGAKNVILTGVSYCADELGSAISDGTKIEYDFNPRIDRMSHGTGDVFASVFAGAIMRGRSALDSAALAADVVCEAIKAAETLKAEGINARVINMATIKPLDTEIVIKAAKEIGAIVTAEEHLVSGGLGSAVLEALAENPVPVVRIGVEDTFGKSGPANTLLDEFGLRAENIVAKAKKAISLKK